MKIEGNRTQERISVVTHCDGKTVALPLPPAACSAERVDYLLFFLFSLFSRVYHFSCYSCD